MRLPPHIRAQLYAIGARVAWWYIGPMGLQVPGEASESSAPVTTAEQKDLGRLVFLDAPPPPPV